ncbi:MAG TPA: glycine cleavage system protein GcvH [Candidatus Goldiibacteriota bacterium]|nr:glycine cleavage system protein GcvH [Candidatus Goldiibacteriota bacterium]
MNIKDGYFYTKEHEWVKVDGAKAKIGISDYAQHKLGDITFVDLPQVGKQAGQFEALCGIESVKAASDIFAPLAGKVISVNSGLETSPELINKDPYEGGWIAEIEITDASGTKNLMDSKAYGEYVKGLE